MGGLYIFLHQMMNPITNLDFAFLSTQTLLVSMQLAATHGAGVVQITSDWHVQHVWRCCGY